MWSVVVNVHLFDDQGYQLWTVNQLLKPEEALTLDRGRYRKKTGQKKSPLTIGKKSKEVEKVKNGRRQENKNKQLHFLTNRFRRDFTFYPILSDIVWVLRRPCSFTLSLSFSPSLSACVSLSLSLSLLTSRVKFLERRPGKEVIN